MKNKNYFSVSSAIIGENFKLYWYVPVLSFIIYFFSGIFPMLVRTQNQENLEYLIEYGLKNSNFAYCVLMIFVPLIAAVQMMAFIHKENKALFIHSQPFSKSRIFNSHVLSGWLMCILPIILMTIMYLLFKGNHYTVSSVASWFAASLSSITFFYGVYVLAGFLTGTTAMHILVSGLFFGIVPVSTWLGTLYCSKFLAGYTGMSDFVSDCIMGSNPILEIISGDADPLSTKMCLLYIFLGIVLILLARLAYAYIKLEKVGDTMLFKVTEEIITYMIVFVGMTAFAFFLESAVPGKTMFLLGMIIGALITFTIVKIVINKSVKIINKENLISLAIVFLASAVLVAFTVYDVGGYSKRLPSEEKIAGVKSENLIANFESNVNHYQSDLGDELFTNTSTIEDSEFLSKVVDIQKYIIENKLYLTTFEETSYNDSIECEYMTFYYVMNDGGTFKRNYSVGLDDKLKEMLDDVTKDPNYVKCGMLMGNINIDKIDYVLISSTEYMSYLEKYGLDEKSAYDDLPADTNVAIMKDKDEIIQFFTARDEDISQRSYLGTNTFKMNVDYPVSVTVKFIGGKELYFDVASVDIHTLEFIEKIKVTTAETH